MSQQHHRIRVETTGLDRGPTNVAVKIVRGLGANGKTYAGGFVEGFVPHKNSMFSAADLRAFAAALLKAAEGIDSLGYKSFEEVR